MGTIQHHAAVVVVYDYMMPDAAAAVSRVQLFADQLTVDALPYVEDWRSLIVGPFPTLVNGGCTYVFLPDGSKRGWDTAERGNRLRERFLEALHPYAEALFDASDGDAGPMIDKL
jgi:hypothetical protein